MAAALNNLFNFSRPLPPPFDTLPNKKVAASSKYGDGTQATLCSTVVKAVNAVCACMNGTDLGAVGIIDHRTVAEYKSATGPDAYHLVVYDSNNGAILASVYDKNTETFESYVLNSSGRDGAAVMMAMFPVLDKDEEFAENFTAYYDQYISGFSDLAAATNSMAILCDNVYRRVKDEKCLAHIKAAVDKSGNLMRVSQAQLDSGAFTPTNVTAGEFTIFANTGPAPIKKASTVVEHSDFVGKYECHPRLFTPQEQALIPELPEWYIIPPEVVACVQIVQALFTRPGHNGKIRSHAQLPAARPCRNWQDYGSQSHRRRTAPAIHEVHLLRQHGDL